MSTPIFDALTAAEQGRDKGMQQAEDHADPRVIASIDAAIDELNASGQQWSANDLRKVAPTAGPLIGARVRAAATRRPREMVRVGYVPSDLPSTHAHPIALWKGVAGEGRVAS
jgi:hypothetical protein